MALPDHLRVFLLPYRRFGPRAAVVAVLFTAVVCGGATLATADIVADTTSGTSSIDNPNKPPAWTCDRETGFDATPPGCSAPAEVEVDRSDHASTAIRQLLGGTLFAIVGTWLLFTGLFTTATTVPAAGTRAAWALPPLTIPAVVRVAAARRLAPARAWPAELDALTTAVRRVALGDGATTVTVAGLVALVAIGLVLYAMARDVGIDQWGPLGAVVAVAVLAVGPVLGPPSPDDIGLGLLLVAVGLPTTLAPRLVSRISAQTSLIGYSGSDQVEPTAWRVGVEHAFGLLLIAAGLCLARFPAYLI